MEIYLVGIPLIISGAIFILSPFWLSYEEKFFQAPKNKTKNLKVFAEWIELEKKFKKNLISNEDLEKQQKILKDKWKISERSNI